VAIANSPILLDNCAISACFELGGWNALVKRYRLETVEEVAIEAATGFQHHEIIDPAIFRQQVIVHKVTRNDRLARAVEYESLGALDDGERDLWIHALGRQDAWVLCGPDIASIRFGVLAGHAGRLVSLEELLDQIGQKPKGRMREHFTKKWLQAKIHEFSLSTQFTKLKK
jgi:hypothetical protein